MSPHSYLQDIASIDRKMTGTNIKLGLQRNKKKISINIRTELARLTEIDGKSHPVLHQRQLKRQVTCTRIQPKKAIFFTNLTKK